MAQHQQKKKSGNPASQRGDLRKPGATGQYSIQGLWGLLVILLITFIAFFPSLKDTFVNWDDFGYLRDNPIIKDLSSKNIKHIFNPSTDIKGNYHPLTILSYCIEYNLFKLNPFPYHLTNVLLHLMNVVLVFLSVKMLLVVTSDGWRVTSERKPAVHSSPVTRHSSLVPTITALLFALHPLRVESVTWVAERKDVLYTFFFLASLYCYLAYINTQKVTYYFASILLFVLSILSKGQAVVLAPILILTDYFIKRKFDRKVWLEKVPFFALAIIFGIVAMMAQHTQLTEQRLEYYTPLQRVFIASYGLLMYLYKLILPVKLSCFYPYPGSIDRFFYVAPVIVLALAFGVWRLVRSQMKPFMRDTVIFGFLFFLITISIVLQLLPVGDAVIAERYTYIPYIGLFFIIANIYSSLLQNQKLKTILITVGVIYVGWIFIMTFNQTKVWKDSRSLWTSVIENYPNTAVAYDDRGLDYYENNEFEKALADFNNAILYKKDYYEAYNNRGLTKRMLKQYNSAIADFQTSMKLNAEYNLAVFNCGLAYLDVKLPDSAIYYFNRALKADPNNASYYYNMAMAYTEKANPDMAIQNYTRAIELNPNYEEAYNNRGYLYSQHHQYDSAIADFTRSLEINRNSPLAFANRSAAYYESHNYKAALDDALAAKALGNNMGDSYIKLLQENAK